MYGPGDMQTAYQKIVNELATRPPPEGREDVLEGPAQFALELKTVKMSEYRAHLTLDDSEFGLIRLVYGWLENTKGLSKDMLTRETVALTAGMSALGRFAEECGLTYRYGLNTRYEPVAMIGHPTWKDDVVVLQPPELH